MRRFELALTGLLVPLDLIGAIIGVYFANHLRTELNILPIDGSRISYPGFAFLIWYFPLLVFFFAHNRLYVLKETSKWVQQLFRVISATASAAMLQFMVILVGRTPYVALHFPIWEQWANRVSILTIFYFWGLTILAVTILRWLYRILINQLSIRKIGRRRLVIIGNTKAAAVLYAEATQRPALGYWIVGVIATRENGIDLPLAGKLEDAENIIARLKPDEVLQADTELSERTVLSLIEAAHDNQAEFLFAPNLFEVRAANVRVSTLGDMPLLELRRTPLDGWGMIIKRILDISLSLSLIILTMPILFLTAFLVKLQDGGPVLFGQNRISGGKPFRILKFRSMVADAESMDERLRLEANERQGPLFKMRNDPRVTKLGKFLRRSRIDELPQLFNVFVGEMSLIGPRPHLAKEVEKYGKQHRKVLAIKSGMTGISQISGSSDLNFEEEVRLDTYYIENWSMLKDLEILIKTPFVIIFKDRSGC